MPQVGLQTYPLLKFTGLRNWESDNRIPNNFLFQAENSDFSGGMWKSSKGVEGYLDPLVGGTSIRGLLYYPWKQPGNTALATNFILEVYNKKIYLIDTDTDTGPSEIMGSRNTDENVCGLVFNNDAYFNSLVDGMAWYNPQTGWSTTFTGGIVEGITVTASGAGYVATPDVTLVGGGGTGALAQVNGIDITGVNLITAGAGYTGNPDVIIDPPTGLDNPIQATGYATINGGGLVNSIVLTNKGNGYVSAPNIAILNGGGSGASAKIVFKINSVALLNAGINYTSAPTVTFSTGAATATTTILNGIPPSGTMMEANSGKIWTAGGGTNPSVVVYSRTATADHPEYARDYTAGSGRAQVGEGGYITAIKNLKATMYVFKNNAIHFLSGFNTSSGPYPIPIFGIYAVTSGAANNNCVVQVENDLWFLTLNGEVRSLGAVAGFIGDQRSNDVSLAIKRFFSLLSSDFSQAAMSYQNKVLKIEHRTIDSPTNNWEFTYDFNDFGWSIKRLIGAKQYCVTNNRRFFSEDGISGQLYLDETGYTMNGYPFPWRGDTLMIDAQRPDLNKRLRYIEIDIARSEGQVVTVNVYKESFNDIPTQFILEAPTAEEIGPTIVNTDDGEWGGDEWGNEEWGGNSDIEPGQEPTIYRRIFKIDYNETGAQFAVGLEGIINGGRVVVYQINHQSILLPEKNRRTDL